MNQFDYVIAMERVANITTIKGVREEAGKAYSILSSIVRKPFFPNSDTELSFIIRAWSYLTAAVHSHTGKNPLPKRFYKEIGEVYCNIAYHLVASHVPDDILYIYRNPYVK